MSTLVTVPTTVFEKEKFPVREKEEPTPKVRLPPKLLMLVAVAKATVTAVPGIGSFTTAPVVLIETLAAPVRVISLGNPSTVIEGAEACRAYLEPAAVLSR